MYFSFTPRQLIVLVGCFLQQSDQDDVFSLPSLGTTDNLPCFRRGCEKRKTKID